MTVRRGGLEEQPFRPKAAPLPGSMTVRGAAFLGVGAMVGAGIFALLGEAGAVAGAASGSRSYSRGSWPACSATPS